MHRCNPSSLSRMRTEYVVKLQAKYYSRIEKLENDIAAASSTSHRNKQEKEQDKFMFKLKEEDIILELLEKNRN